MKWALVNFMSPENISELALLYALDSLDELDQALVDDHLINVPEFQGELAEAESVVSMLAYSVEPVAIASNLKARLFQRIAASDEIYCDEIATLLKQAKSANWEPYRFTSGVQIATSRIDLETRQVDCFIRSFGKTQFPQHRHAEDEEIIVLDGDLVIGAQKYAPGDRVYSQSGTIHQPETLNGCTIFIRTSLDDELL